MADVTLTITLPDIEARALATVVASLGPEQFEHAYQHWLNHWKAHETYSPQVEASMVDFMGEAAERVYEALADAGCDVLTRLGPRSRFRRMPRDGTTMGHAPPYSNERRAKKI
jgi:hypothetical protein